MSDVNYFDEGSLLFQDALSSKEGNGNAGGVNFKLYFAYPGNDLALLTDLETPPRYPRLSAM